MKLGLAEISVGEASGISGDLKNQTLKISIYYYLKKKINDYTFSLYKHPNEEIFT